MEPTHYDQESEAINASEMWGFVDHVVNARMGVFTTDKNLAIKVKRNSDGKLVKVEGEERLWAMRFNEKYKTIQERSKEFLKVNHLENSGIYAIVDIEQTAGQNCVVNILASTSSDSASRKQDYIFEVEIDDVDTAKDLANHISQNPMVIKSFLERVFSEGKPTPGEVLQTYINTNMGKAFESKAPNSSETPSARGTYIGLSPFRYLATATIGVNDQIIHK